MRNIVRLSGRTDRTDRIGRACVLACAAALLLPVTLLPVMVSLTPTPALAWRIVYDPTNYSQNLLSAARALEQIQNQITSLQNEAQMLINQARNLTSLPTSLLSQIDGNFSQMQVLLRQADRSLTMSRTSRASSGRPIATSLPVIARPLSSSPLRNCAGSDPSPPSSTR